MTVQEKRKKITEKLLSVMEVADKRTKNKPNYNRYKMMLEVMTDKEFMDWASGMGKELDDAPQIFHVPMKEEMSFEQLEKMMEIIGAPIDEYIVYRDKSVTPIRSIERVPVIYIDTRKLQQYLNKKNKISLDTDKRAMKSGQTTGESKGAAISDLESSMLLSVGGDEIIKELYGPRSDGYDKKHDFYQQITNYGSANLSELEEDLTKHTTLNTINTYLIASGIRSDLVTKTLKTAYTLKKEMSGRR